MNSVAFGGHTVDLPPSWSVDVGDRQLLAARPEEGPFTRNVVIQVVDADVDAVADLARIGGSVVLSRGRSVGALAAEEIVFGYPLPVAAVTAVQLVGDPTPEGRLLVTYSADATRFADHWPEARGILRSVRRTP